MEEIFCRVLNFGAILHARGWWEELGLSIHLCACSSAESQEQPLPQVASLCADGVRETGDSSVLSPTDDTTKKSQSLSASFFFFLL